MRKAVFCFFLIITLCLVAFAHPGDIDARGGHRDNNNISGLGSYHYHHGHPAHRHYNGVCEYSITPSAEKGETSDSIEATAEPKQPATQAHQNPEIAIAVMCFIFLIGLLCVSVVGKLFDNWRK